MTKTNGRELSYYMRLPYTILLEPWDDGEGQYWVARVAELPHCMIHAETAEEAVRDIEEVKRDWIESNLERGLAIPEPRPRRYSGQIRLRITPSLHRILADRAETEGVSLNQYMGQALAQSVGIAAKRRRKTTRGRRAN
jgi:antitoxin HicB